MIRRHAYGAVLIGLGAWETAAFAGVAPTITDTCRRHKTIRLIVIGFMAGAAKHLWEKA